MMFRILFRLWCVAGYCILTLGVDAASRTDHVFIISIDGGKPAAINQARMPVIQKLVKEGAFTWFAETIKPSITLPSHTSMLTGVPMEKHGVTWNGWAPTNGIVKVPTIFGAAKQAGISTAMFVGKEKFRHLLWPGTVDSFNYDRSNSVMYLKSDDGGPLKKKEGNVAALLVATNAAAYIKEHKPGLCFIHFTDPDTVGHEFGWGSPEQLKAFANVDAALGVVVKAIHQAGLAKRSVIIISADHGGHGKGHSQGTPEDYLIPWIAWGQGVKKHFEIYDRVSTCDTAATALWLLGLDPLAPIDGSVVRSAFK
jgi:predicted AlkP superfamily pyrophosphatase or phosphodiesterase